MEKVILRPIEHEGWLCVGIFCNYLPSLNKMIREIPRVRWSQRKKCFYIGLYREGYRRVLEKLGGKVDLDNSEVERMIAEQLLGIPGRPLRAVERKEGEEGQKGRTDATGLTGATGTTGETGVSGQPGRKALSMEGTGPKGVDHTEISDRRSDSKGVGHIEFTNTRLDPKEGDNKNSGTRVVGSGVSGNKGPEKSLSGNDMVLGGSGPKPELVEGKIGSGGGKIGLIVEPRMPESWISDGNRRELRKFLEQLVLKAYSSSTIRTYKNEFQQLLKLIRNKPVQELTTDDIRRYMVFVLEKHGISEHTAHSRLNALKFYFEQVLGREKFFWDVPRPKKPDQLPKVMAERELERMFAAVTNLKHKALLFTAYSAGLRVSEVVNLRIRDIDSGRMQIRIEQSKGKKDRYVGLSVLLLDVLRAYLQQASPRPREFLFEGDHPGQPYSSRSAQQVFHQARERAGISKQVSFHALRHSFATHLLEKGIDIRYIKDLLGHFSIKTTERYLHVKRQDLITLINPLDELFKGRSWNDESGKTGGKK